MGHRRGGGLRQIKKVSLQVKFFRTTFGIAFYQSNLSTLYTVQHCKQSNLLPVLLVRQNVGPVHAQSHCVEDLSNYQNKEL